MIDMSCETLVPLNQVPKLLPLRSNGKRLHISAIYRWVQRGIKGTRLEATRIGGSTYTSLEALQRFSEQLNHSQLTPSQTPLQPRTRQRQIQKATRKAHEILGLD